MPGEEEILIRIYLRRGGLQEFEIRGAASARFAPAVIEVLEHLGEFTRWEMMLFIHDEGSYWPLVIPIDNLATFSEVLEVLGAKTATAEPAEARVVFGGQGGDGIPDPINAILGSIDRAFQIGGYVSAGVVLWRVTIRAYHQRARRLARDWNASDEISMELRQLVLASDEWYPEVLTRTFGLSESSSGRLLRQLGYHWRTTTNSAHWCEDEYWCRSYGPWRPSDPDNWGETLEG